MTIRERIERQEHEILSPLASFADQSRGRANPEAERDSRTCFQRDTDRIIHSKAFRRLMHKTQVFLQPEGDHYRTRMTHTLEVSRIARAISVGLRLNEDLTEAIAMGHDLGHTPFGHAGEIALSEVTGKPFRHNEQSLRVVDILEKDGAGDDAMRAGILCEEDIPKEISGILGHSHSERINTLVEELITQTGISNTLRMRPKVAEAMDALRTFMFEKVYRNPVAKGEESKARDILKSLYEHYMRHPEQLPENFRPQLDFDGIERVVCDYIACMTDKYAIYQYEQIFIPSGWQMR